MKKMMTRVDDPSALARWSWPLGLWAMVALGCGGEGDPATPDAGRLVCSSDVECDDGVYCNGLEICQPGSDGADATGCAPDPNPPCLANQICVESAQTCRTDCAVDPDADGDGHEAEECRGDDCDDSDANRYPGNTEICDVNGHDEDCDARTFGVRDQDGDGFPDANCCNADENGVPVCGTDCDDTVDSVKPGQVEICDTLDNDCDDTVDENAKTTFYVDADGDGFGDLDEPTIEACEMTGGYVTDWTDCDDTTRGRNPSATEICDGIDNDCDLRVDENVGTAYYPDTDGDSFGDRLAEPTFGCSTAPVGMVSNALDCDDSDQGINPAAYEVCDGEDNNCNGGADEGLTRLLYPDTDLDGYGDENGTPEVRCPTQGWSAVNTDCDDTNRFTYLGAIELCDDEDNDCLGGIDEGTTEVPWYVDDDDDGYGNPNSVPIASCSPIAGRSQLIDCDDTNGDTYPGAPQICDGFENDCTTGNGGSPRPQEDQDRDGHAATLASCSGGPFPKDDCDDSQSDIYTGAVEVCDRIDNNCSTGGGEDLLEDADFDGHSPDGSTCVGGFPVDDCNDARADTYLGAPETCDRRDTDCSGDGTVDPAEDQDQDGHAPIGASCAGGYPRDDCDDTRSDIYPDAPESCDRVDSDCSSGGGVALDEDMDDDGFAPPNATCVGGYPPTDCDDTMPMLAACAPPAPTVLPGFDTRVDDSPWRLGDGNGDGNLDLRGNRTSLWLENDGDGIYAERSGDTWSLVWMGTDIDGDGNGDTVIKRAFDELRWGNTPSGTTRVQANVSTDYWTRAVDVNRDGYGDIINGRELYLNLGPDRNGVLQWELQTPHTPSQHPSGGFGGRGMTAADVDRDGRLDLLLHSDDFGGETRVLSWSRSLSADGRSWGPSRVLYDRNEVGFQSFETFAWGDIDGNGRDDLIFVGNGQIRRMIVDSTPGSEFATVTPSDSLNPLPVTGTAILVVDVDDDGDYDIVTAYDSALVYYENLAGDATLWRRWDYTMPERLERLDVGDIDGDGSADFTWLSISQTNAYVLPLAGGAFGEIEPTDCACWVPVEDISTP